VQPSPRQGLSALGLLPPAQHRLRGEGSMIRTLIRLMILVAVYGVILDALLKH
jgi:hypothetical protein